MIKINCIFCDKPNIAKSIEHIVSESLGNTNYVMQKGRVCDKCNERFSNFEKTALANSIFVMERARFAVKTKKGKNAKGEIRGLTIKGDTDFREGYLTVKGLNEENFEITNSPQRIAQLIIESFDKSEVAVSKLILKVGLESIFTSQIDLFNKFVFKDLKDFLETKNNIDWPFVMTDFEFGQFNNVPGFIHRLHLEDNHCKLMYLNVSDELLLFKFNYGVISITVNLINRNLNWIEEVLQQDANAILYPIHFRNKIKKKI